MRVAIIPARGGSKRIPHKNIRQFHAKPMIAWVIEAAISSNCFDHVVVSTDSEKILTIASRFGEVIPLVRPPQFSDDYTPLVPVVRHAITELEQELGQIEDVCCILPTAPMIRSCDIVATMRKLQERRNSYVLSITSYPFPVQRAVRLSEDGCVIMVEPEYYLTRSQDLEETFHDAGQFYWGSRNTWRTKDRLFDEAAYGHLIPRYRVQDIDTPEDWRRAELMFSAIQKEEKVELSR
jgi:pseudaminic acid cytidylyltransferase